MPILLKCSNGHKLRVKDAAAGNRVRCPHCHDIIRVPVSAKPRPRQSSEEFAEIPDENFPAQSPLPRLQRKRVTAEPKRTPAQESWKMFALVGGAAAVLAAVAVSGILVFRSNQSEESEPAAPPVAATDPADENQHPSAAPITEPAQHSTGFASPEAAFRAFQAAVGESDWKQAALCTTEESQVAVAEGLVLVVSFLVAFDENRKPEIEKVFSNHGLNLDDDSPNAASLSEEDNPLAGLANSIDDKPAFIDDLMQVLTRAAEDSNESDTPFVLMAQGNLVDIRIDGDTATGTLDAEQSDPSEPTSIEFRKAHGNWLVHFPDEALAFDVPGETGGDLVQEPVGQPEKAADPQPPPAAQVVPGDLQKKLSLSYKAPFGLFPPQGAELLFVTLELAGQAAEQATAYGFLRIKPVRDNTGKLLKQVKSEFSFDDPTREFVELGPFSGDAGKLKIHMMYEPPSKEAAKLSSIEGSLQLMTGGKRDEMVFPGILDNLGRKLVDPALTAAGLEVTVRRLRKSDELELLDETNRESAIVVEIDGPIEMVRGTNLLDGNGKYLSSEPGGLASTRAAYTIVLAPEKDLPSDTQLKLYLLSGQEPLTVAFKFENVALSGGEKVPLQTPGTHGGFFSFAFSPDGAVVAGGTGTVRAGDSGKLLGGGEVLLWDVATGKLKKTLGSHGEGVDWLAYSSDGNFLASASKDNDLIKLWDVPAGRTRQTWQAPVGEGEWEKLILAPDGKTIIASIKQPTKEGESLRYQVASWNTENGKETWRLPVSNSPAAAISPDGTRVAAHIVKLANRKVAANELVLCDSRTGDVLKTIDLGRDSPRDGIAFLADGKRIAGLTYRAMRLWDLESGELIKTFNLDPDASYNAITVSRDGQSAVLPHFMGKALEVWDLPTGQPKGKLSFEFPNNIHRPVFSGELTRMVCTQSHQGPVILQITDLEPLNRSPAVQAERTANNRRSNASRPAKGTTQQPASSRNVASKISPTFPRRLTEINSFDVGDAYPWVTPDGLHIFWTRESGNIDKSEVWAASRNKVDEPFGNAQHILDARHPAVTADGLYLLCLDGFGSVRRRSQRLMSSFRATTDQPFSKAAVVSELVNVDSPKSPAISSDGLTLVFQRNTHKARGTEFVICTRHDRHSSWGEPRIIPLSDDPTLTKPLTWPFLSADGMTLWFCHGGAANDSHLMSAKRPNVHEPFGNYQYFEVNGKPVLARAPRFIASTSELYYSAPTKAVERGTWELWVAKLPAEVSRNRVVERTNTLPNAAPPGFKPLFDGKSLDGWKGRVGNPETRANMNPRELHHAQYTANHEMREHWKVTDGMLIFDGQGTNLCTEKDYGDFELLVDWKILKGGDSGVILRGTPQVQIWDTEAQELHRLGAEKGSGGLWNNKKHARYPFVKADNPVGQWNTFRIRMVGERVTVWLNDTLVVDNTVLENHWEPEKPIYPTGQIELQAYGTRLYFRNIYIKELDGS